MAENLERGQRESIWGIEWKDYLILPVKTGIKLRDSVIMRHGISYVSAEQQPTDS